MSRETKAQLMKRLEAADKQYRDAQEMRRREQEAAKAMSKRLGEMHTKLEKLEEQRDEWEHLAESVINGVRDTLNSDHKLYQDHHNTYYALWYWIEWGDKVNKSLKKEDNE